MCEVWVLCSCSCAQLGLFFKPAFEGGGGIWRRPCLFFLGPAIFGGMPHRKRSSRVIHLVWHVDVRESSIPVIALCQKCEKLSGQLKDRFTVRGEVLWISQDISVTCSPRGSTENWEISACPLFFSFRRRENSFLNWVQTLWKRNDLVCHQPLRESLIKVQFGCLIVVRIRKICRSLKPLSRIFLQSWLI